MSVVFKRHELPIAYSMIAAADRVKPRRDGRHPFDKYFLLWIAFKNIYTTIAHKQGYSIELLLEDDGSVATLSNGNVKIPKIKIVSELEQINLALEEFGNPLKTNLIKHPSTQFFAKRIPSWEGIKIEQDAFGQRVNGVINVNYTSSSDYPVWSPIDIQIFESYLENPKDEKARDFLARQIVELLYTVSQNLMYIGRNFSDANDISVPENALPMIEMIVSDFTQ
ncbi:MAG: hypothetical protein PVF83_01965 [Anaerolineales bacterium]|jgi:hypothetical protein